MARPTSDGDGLPSFLFPSFLGTGWTAGFVATLGWVGAPILGMYPPLRVFSWAGSYHPWVTLVPGSLEPSRYLLPSWLTGLTVSWTLPPAVFAL